MKKDNRLRKNHEFQEIINKNKSVVSKYLVVYYLQKKEKKLKVGISVSKKFLNAVGRNKLKRQVRMIMTDINDFAKPLDIVLILRKPFINICFEKKTKLIKEMLKRIQFVIQ